MKTSGAQPGNDNAREGRRWREALRRALARSQGTIDRGLDRLADTVVAKAAAGTPWALEHIAERMDGKSPQVVQVTVSDASSLSDSELADIARRGRAGTAQPSPSLPESPEVH
jgi:hypothetical protein